LNLANTGIVQNKGALQRPRGRGGLVPQQHQQQAISHHPHAHHGQVDHHGYPPGAYPDMDDGGDMTPESGSPDGTIDGYIPPGPMGPNPHWDAMMAENARLKEEMHGVPVSYSSSIV